MGQDPSPAGNIRIGYRERDAVAAVLQEAAGDGRLSMAELDDRLDDALHAKTYADLDPLVADLSVELPSHALNSSRPRAQGPPLAGYSARILCVSMPAWAARSAKGSGLSRRSY